jgi:hypothetical protein
LPPAPPAPPVPPPLPPGPAGGGFGFDFGGSQFCFDGGLITICVGDGSPGVPGPLTIPGGPVGGLQSPTPFQIGESAAVQLPASPRGQWFEITLSRFYFNPVVIIGPAPNNGGDPAFARVREVRAGSFQVTIDEWEHNDGQTEGGVIGYVVVEAGTYLMPNGKWLSAGHTVLDHQWAQPGFPLTFPTPPVVVSQVDTDRERDPVVTRQQQVTEVSFQARLQEGVTADGTHFLPERVSWLAVEEGSQFGFGPAFSASKTLPVFSGNEFAILSGTEEFQPAVIAAMQTAGLTNPSSLGYRFGFDTVFGSIQQGIQDGGIAPIGFERIGTLSFVPGPILVAAEMQAFLVGP